MPMASAPIATAVKARLRRRLRKAERRSVLRSATVFIENPPGSWRQALCQARRESIQQVRPAAERGRCAVMGWRDAGADRALGVRPRQPRPRGRATWAGAWVAAVRNGVRALPSDLPETLLESRPGWRRPLRDIAIRTNYLRARRSRGTVAS